MVQALTDEDQKDAAALLSQAYSASARSCKELWDQSFIGSVPIAELSLSGASGVVDVGADVVTLLSDLLNAAPDPTVVGVDRSEGMIVQGPVRIPAVSHHFPHALFVHFLIGPVAEHKLVIGVAVVPHDACLRSSNCFRPRF